MVEDSIKSFLLMLMLLAVLRYYYYYTLLHSITVLSLLFLSSTASSSHAFALVKDTWIESRLLRHHWVSLKSAGKHGRGHHFSGSMPIGSKNA
jgi:hypothetical protein